ncbi:MAG: PqqD family protein [Kiritimatiellae bacterium]|nr:PqqD family protein [Kiritimatiellia bacterium]
MTDGISAIEILESVPLINQAVEVDRGNSGGAIIMVPMKRPRYLIPPLSWLLPFSKTRQLRLDQMGMAILDLCDGNSSIEAIIEKFAVDNKLSYREAQIPVMKFMRLLTERGIVVVAKPSKPEREEQQTEDGQK